MKKLISLMLAVLVVFSCAAGCKAPPAPNSTTDVEIVYWESGWGREFMDVLVDNFNKKQTTYTAILQASAETGTGPLHLAPDTNSVDLYITTMEGRLAYSQYLEPLNDFVQRKPDGESGKTIAQKMGDFTTASLAPDGKLYTLPWTTGSITGLLYNEDMLKDTEGNAYDLPRTTEELIGLVNSIRNDGQTPFVYAQEYWNYIFEAWVIQLEGIENYRKIEDCIYTDSQGVEHANDVRMIIGEGKEGNSRYEAYDVMYRLLSPYGNTVTNTNSFTHTEAQTYFLDGEAVFQPNGSWIEKENSAEGINIKMMKTPVISALAPKLGISEDDLCVLVDYVDGKTLSSDDLAWVNGLDDDIVERVREARTLHYCYRPADIFIPNYSNCKDGAMAFLEYYYSDEGMKITQEVLKTYSGLEYSVEPTIDTTNWTTFMKQVGEIRKTANMYTSTMDKPLLYLGGISKFYNYLPTQMAYTANENDKLTIDAFWAREVKYWTDNWDRILTDAGLQSAN